MQANSVPKYVAFVLGGTGATGRALVTELLRSPLCKEVVSLSRRSVLPAISQADTEGGGRADAGGGLDTSKLREIIVDDLDPILLPDSSNSSSSGSVAEIRREAFRPDVDVAFSCMGTTIKTAGSTQVFQKVDRDYVLRTAELVRANAKNLRQFSVVTSIGADPNSWFMYVRTKGEVEQGLAEMGLPRLAVFRPSLLIGERPGDFRLGETIGQWMSPVVSALMVGPLRKFRGIRVEDVARGMLVDWETQWTAKHESDKKETEVAFIDSSQIQELADSSRK